MLKYNGVNYNLDCLFQFQVLKQLLEALAKKQSEYDSILYGANLNESNSNINEENNESQNNYTEIKNDNKNINYNYENKNYDNTNNRRYSDTSSKDIMEIIDLYGLKDGIKKNNELILSLNKRIEELEKKSSKLSPDTIKDNIKTELLKTIQNNNKENKEENKEKFKNLEEKINEISNNFNNINNKTENYLEIIDKNKKELMEIIYKNKKDIQKNKENIDDLKKNLNEYINSKISQLKYNINEEINKKFDDLNDKFTKNITKNIEIINSKIDQINNQFKEQEKKIFSIEENHKKTSENISKQISLLTTFKTEQKSTNSKIRNDISTLKLMNESFNNNIRQINDLLQNDTIQTLLSEINNISSRIVDAEEYKKTIDLINIHLKDLQSDNNQYRRYFDDIVPLIGKITTVEDLKKLEELLRKLLEEQDSNAQKKYADKSEIIKNIKNISSQIKKLMKNDKNKEKTENCMLASSPISNYRCASCENFIGNLKNNTQYFPWNKFPTQDMIIKPYRIGNGFSHFLQNINIENSLKNNSTTSDRENNNNLNNNNINLNNVSIDKIKNNKKVLPMVNNNILKNNKSLNNIIEIKAHFETDHNSNENNNKYMNSYFTKTVYNNSFKGNKLNNNLTTGINRNNIFTNFENNINENNKTNYKAKNEETKKQKFLNIKKISDDNKDKYIIDSPINKNEKNKKENYKLIYDNIK